MDRSKSARRQNLPNVIRATYDDLFAGRGISRVALTGTLTGARQLPAEHGRADLPLKSLAPGAERHSLYGAVPPRDRGSDRRRNGGDTGFFCSRSGEIGEFAGFLLTCPVDE